MSNLNWPEGATHYLQAGEEQTRFRDLSGDKWKYFNGYTGEWVQHYFSSEDLLRRHDLIARPQPKPWSGPEDGLPPTGTVCDARIIFGNAPPYVIENLVNLGVDVVNQKPRFQKVSIKFMGEKYVVLQSSGETIAPLYCVEFRPIKTSEQIASDKRETAIRELMDIAQVDCRVTAARLIDAGFKREVV